MKTKLFTPTLILCSALGAVVLFVLSEWRKTESRRIRDQQERAEAAEFSRTIKESTRSVSSIPLRSLGIPSGAAAAIPRISASQAPPRVETAESATELEAAISKSEARAVALYPDSGTAGSALYQAIVTEFERLTEENPKAFDDPDYPLTIASKCAAKLGIEPSGKSAHVAALVSKSGAWMTPEDYQKLTIERFPMVAIADSAMNRLFVAKVAEKRRVQAWYFIRSDWPLTLAQECNEIMEAMNKPSPYYTPVKTTGPRASPPSNTELASKPLPRQTYVPTIEDALAEQTAAIEDMADETRRLRDELQNR